MQVTGGEIPEASLDQLFTRTGDIARDFGIDKHDLYQYFIDSANYMNMASSLEHAVPDVNTQEQKVDYQVALIAIMNNLKLPPDFSNAFIADIIARALISKLHMDPIKEKIEKYIAIQTRVIGEASAVSETILQKYVKAKIPEGYKTLENHQKWVREILEKPELILNHEKAYVGMITNEEWNTFLEANKLSPSIHIPLFNAAANVYALQKLTKEIGSQARSPMGLQVTEDFAEQAGKMVSDPRHDLNYFAMELGYVCGGHGLEDLTDLLRKSSPFTLATG